MSEELADRATASMSLCSAAVEAVRDAYRAGRLGREDAISKLVAAKRLHDQAADVFLANTACGAGN